MAGLRRPIFLAAACVAAMALPTAGDASDGSVSIADAPGGGTARARHWTTPPTGRRAARTFRSPAAPAVTPAPRTVIPATPRWIEVPATPSQPAGASDPSYPAPPPVGDAAPAPVVIDDRPVAPAPVAPRATQPRRRRGSMRRGRTMRRAAAPRQTTPVQFRFAVGDEILISIWDDDVESGTIDLRQRILRDGTISPLWLDPIRVQGRTIAEVRGELVEAYKEYYKIPRITVGVESVHLERAFVLGEVQTPAAIDLNGPQTLLQVLAQAGGITPTLGNPTVRVLRSRGANCRPRVFTVNTERSSCGRGRSFMVMPGDVVYVHPSGLANWSRTLTTALAPIQSFFGATGGAAATYLAFDQIANDDNNQTVINNPGN